MYSVENKCYILFNIILVIRTYVRYNSLVNIKKVGAYRPKSSPTLHYTKTSLYIFIIRFILFLSIKKRGNYMENLKEQCINDILNDMYGCIDDKKLSFLKHILVKNFNNLDFTSKKNELTVNEVDMNTFLIQKFCVAKRSKNLSTSTINQYRRAIKNLLLFYDDKSILEINGENIEYYFAIKMTKGEWSASYTNTIRMYLLSFFTYLTNHDYIAKNPMRSIELIKSDNKKKEILNGKEIVEIQDACKNEKELALVDLLLSTGVRVSEVVNIKISDIDFDKGIVNIYGVKTRTWRSVYLNNDATKHIQDYLNTRTDMIDILFLSTRKTKTSKNKIQSILKDIGERIKSRKHFTVHLFRKTFATLLFRKGIDLPSVSKLLGHKDCSVTEKHYLILMQDDIYNNYKKLCA